MKHLIIILLLSFTGYTQTYKLLPDSCTFCMYYHTTGGSTFYLDDYLIDPTTVTTIGANDYMQVYDGWLWGGSYYVRQEGNKVYSIHPDSATYEVKLMDFDVSVGDTLDSLFSDGYYYSAEVIEFDSTQLVSGVYHNYVVLKGFDSQPSMSVSEWFIKWQEGGLCNQDYYNPSGSAYGGVLRNVPVNELIIEVAYYAPNYCTSDTLYPNNMVNVVCNNCTIQVADLEEEQVITNKILIRITDLLGRETPFKPNTPLIYIYSDGTTEKVYRME